MIQNLPTKIKLPNFYVTIEFEESFEDEFYGKVYKDDYKIVLANKNPKFNNYLFFSFLIYIIGIIYDLKLTGTKYYSLGYFLYHVLLNNDIKTLMKAFRTKKAFEEFSINVPTFDALKVLPHFDDNLPLGLAKISTGEISIYGNCSARLKDVILIHEIVEWVNAIHRLNLPHSAIQTLAEILTFVIKNNKFIL
jgi:hypothetical protein